VKEVTVSLVVSRFVQENFIFTGEYRLVKCDEWYLTEDGSATHWDSTTYTDRKGFILKKNLRFPASLMSLPIAGIAMDYSRNWIACTNSSLKSCDNPKMWVGGGSTMSLCSSVITDLPDWPSELWEESWIPKPTQEPPQAIEQVSSVIINLEGDVKKMLEIWRSSMANKDRKSEVDWPVNFMPGVAGLAYNSGGFLLAFEEEPQFIPPESRDWSTPGCVMSLHHWMYPEFKFPGKDNWRTSYRPNPYYKKAEKENEKS